MPHNKTHGLGSSDHTSATVAQLNALISNLIATYGGLRDIGVGTLAQRPAFGTANRFWWATDNQQLYRDAGTVWNSVKAPDSNYLELTDAGYTVLTSDGYRYIYVSTGAVNRTINLPAVATNDKREITIKKIDSGVGSVIIDGNASETIDGALTQAIPNISSSITIQCVNGKWYSTVVEGLSFGEMYQFANAVETVINTQNVWEEVDNFTAGVISNVTVGTSDMTIAVGAAGTYSLDCTLTCVPAVNFDTFQFSVSINNVIVDKVRQSRKLDKGTDPSLISLTGLLTLVDGDVVKLETRNLDGTGNITIVSANLNVVRLV